VARGHSVLIYAAHSHPYKTEKIDGINIVWLPVPYDNSYGFARRSGSFLRYVTQVIRHFDSTNTDLLYTISVPLTTGLVALWLRWRFRIPFLFEVGDLWPDAPIQLGFVRNNLLIRLLYNLERTLYRRAKGIVALSEPIADAIRIKAPDASVEVIPNMADTVFFGSEDSSSEVELNGRFVLTYAGSLGYANGLHRLIECAHASQEAGLPLQFLICGKGAMETSLKNAVSNLALKNVSILPFTNREGVKKAIRSSHCVVVSYQNIPVLETGSPHKYFDGLAAGKLIFTNVAGWIKEEIEKSECGFYADSPDVFVQKIRVFLENPDHLMRYQRNARALAEHKYSREMLAEKYVSLIEGALKPLPAR
jgi:glycosyltransferase involved in cell wall biosynthesis